MTRQSLAAIYVVLLGGVVLSPVHGMYVTWKEHQQFQEWKRRSGWTSPDMATGRGRTDAPPSSGKPAALAIIERSYDEQGKGIDQMGGVVLDEGPVGVLPRLLRNADQGTAVRAGTQGHLQGRQGHASDYTTTLDYFWWWESRCGKDKRWKITGPAGERGEYQITPIFAAEVQRLGYEIDVFDNASCRDGITIWLEYWAPRVFKGKPTIGELYEMYRRGPKGYRDWRRRLEPTG